MANVFDVLEWSAFLLLFFRSLGVGVFAFASINASIFVRASIQVIPVGKGAPFTTRNRSAGPDSNGHDGKRVTASDHRRNPPRPPKAAQSPQSQGSFDHDESLVSPKQQLKPSCASIMSMYEEIMASDAETIQVQQATIHSQQEIIRSQRGMIQKLQQLIEGQDAWIEDHLEELSR